MILESRIWLKNYFYSYLRYLAIQLPHPFEYGLYPGLGIGPFEKYINRRINRGKIIFIKLPTFTRTTKFT
jgi:hypothetical protein